MQHGLKWMVEFKRGRTKTKDTPRQEKPKTATSTNCRLKLVVIGEIVRISKKRALRILHQVL